MLSQRIHQRIHFAVITMLMMVPAGTMLALDSGAGLPGGNAAQGIPAGNFVIYPTLELLYQYEDNLFFTPSFVQRVKSSSYVVRPKIMAEMPFLTSYFRLGYSAEYRDYDEYSMRNNWTHTVIADLQLILNNGMTITAQDRYTRTTLYTEAFDKNREVVWGNQPFVTNTMSLEIKHKVGTRIGISTGGTYTTIRFDEPDSPDEPATFFDYTSRNANLGVSFVLNPLTSVKITATRGWNEQDRSSQNLDSERKTTSEALHISLRESLTPTLSGGISVGYSRSHYDQLESQPSAGQGEYRGVVYVLQLSNRFSPKTTMRGNLFRTENQSSFLGNNYYVSTGGMMTITQNLSDITFWSLGLSYQQNSYPALSTEAGAVYLGERRDDDMSGVKLGIGMYFLERGSARLNYTYQDRDSSIGAYGYKSNRYTAQVQMGW